MDTVKGFVSNIYKSSRWTNMLFYAEFALTLLILALLKDTKNQSLMLIYFLIGAVISNLMVLYLSGKITKVCCTMERLKEEAAKDYLTGLDNVRSFDKSFNELISKARGNEESIALLAIDVDLFKRVNDTYGHAAGDAVLRELSTILLKSVRDFDVVGRVGGEEFSVILRDCTKERTLEIAERIRRNIEGDIFVLPCGSTIKVTVSIGVAVYPATVTDVNLLKEEADSKLYRAKHSGRNTICI
ncbi:diguanylate cyclase domain protein [Clostridiales bacterium oral taxon 876 str. F0540]|nr:diguanylate cyclase domain protein [Clostridiales bacterium oral taxon 876 str. F0540]